MKAALCLIIILLCGTNAVPAPQEAAPQTAPPHFTAPPLAEDAAASLSRILSSEDFGTEKPDWEIRFKKEIDFDSGGIDFRLRNFKFPWLKEALGIAVRTVLIVAVVFVLAFSARYMYKRRPFSGAGENGVRAGAAGGRADDPAGLLARAEALYRAGGIREAWALCFRAYIAVLGRRRGMAFPPEATEYEALAIAGEEGGGADGGADCGAFSEFVAQWVNFAYGGRLPAAGAFETALSSCRLLFEAPGIPARGAP